MLSKRLNSLVKYVEVNDKIIDIGCDHALLDIYLIENNILDSIIVSDIHKFALDAGINNIKKAKLTKKIDARLGDGLEVLTGNDKIDTVLISGMGSNTIINILNNKYLKNINKLIIQSNNDHNLLRSKIVDFGFYISDEEYFQDNGKNYINIIFKRGIRKYKKDELLYGPILIKDNNYLNFELNKLEKISMFIPNMKLKNKIKLKRQKNKLNKLINKNN